MKYEYLKQIDEALTKIICSEAGLHYNLKSKGVDNGKRGDFDELSHDVEEAFSILESGKWPFRCDNSDRFVSGAPIPPEISLIGGEMFACRRICEAIADESSDIGFRARWGNYGARFLEWSMLIRQYYPTDASTPTQAAPKAEKRPSGRPTAGELSNYLNAIDEDAFKAEISPKLKGKTAGVEVGKVFVAAIKEGKLINKYGCLKAFCDAFGINNSSGAINSYLKRRGFKINTNDAE